MMPSVIGTSSCSGELVVADRIAVRFAVKRRLVDPLGDAQHGEAVGELRLSPAVEVRRLVPERELREGRLEVTLGHAAVLRLDHLAEHVNDVEGLRQAHESRGKSSIVPVRFAALADRSRSADPATGANTTWRPSPRGRVRAGLRAMRLASAGTVARAVVTRAAVEPHHLARVVHVGGRPPRAPRARRGDNTRMPWRSRIPSAARCMFSTWSSENILTGSKGVDEVSVARRALRLSGGTRPLGISPARSHRQRRFLRRGKMAIEYATVALAGVAFRLARSP